MPLKFPLIAACLLLSACSDSNNLLLGTVSANLDSHHIVVTDCYRTEVPQPERFIAGGLPSWRFVPCRDAAIEIRGDKLTVNGRAYGHIEPTDGILVDHGVVSVQQGGAAQRAGN